MQLKRFGKTNKSLRLHQAPKRSFHCVCRPTLLQEGGAKGGGVKEEGGGGREGGKCKWGGGAREEGVQRGGGGGECKKGRRCNMEHGMGKRGI